MHRRKPKFSSLPSAASTGAGSTRARILEAVDRVCKNASFILGEEAVRFEKEFTAYVFCVVAET